MNGRMYDPLVGRFISPDPYVQMHDLTQNMNRYSYCLNNPLLYTDPTGYNFFKKIKKAIGKTLKVALNVTVGVIVVSVGTILAVAVTATSTVVGLGQAIFTGNTNILKNEVKIIGGVFTGSLKQIVSRNTWELPQTILGYTYSQFENSLGKVKDVSYYDGATLVEHYKEGIGGVTLGSYINASRGTEAKPTNTIFQHEYGHYLQSQDEGWGYLTKDAIPSGWNLLKYNDRTKTDVEKHAAFRTEQDANRRARDYFGEDVWNYKVNPIFNSGHNYDFDQYNSPYGKIHNSIRIEPIE